MNHSEKEYIGVCKRLIEEKFDFETDKGSLRQRDLEYLADRIEETSAIKLSLSTLKRLWKPDYDHTPHPSTLQALVSVLGYSDWHEFKATQIFELPAAAKTRNGHFIKGWMALPALLAVAVIFWLIAFRSDEPASRKPLIKGPVSFTGNKTIAYGVPNTVIFQYDLRNVEADSFFFQQSWNDAEKIRINPKGHYYSNIYYYPGFHKAKLIANDSILKRFRVHVTTEGWLPLVRNSLMDKLPTYLKKGSYQRAGKLHVTRNDLISSNVNVDKDFILSYYNVRDFGNISSSDFFLDTRLSCDSNNTVACPGVQVVIICEAHIFYVGMMGKGCERDIALKVGEVYHDGVHDDLSMFGRNLYSWQHLQVSVVNKQATIYLNDQPVYRLTFKQDFGKVVGLVYNFIGTGAIENVSLKNKQMELVYQEDFNE